MSDSWLPENPRILIVKPSALGDICHALPVLDFLRSRFPKGRIGWLVNKSLASLLSGQKEIDELVSFDRGAFSKGLFQGLKTWKSLRKTLKGGRWDLVLDLQGLARSGLLTWLTGAPQRWGLSDCREGSWLSYNRRVNVPKGETHAVVRYWQFARALGASELPCQPRLSLPGEVYTKALETMTCLPKPWFVVAPGARWVTKRWPPEFFAQVANLLVKNHGGSVWIVGAPDEVDLGKGLSSSLAVPGMDLTGKTTLLEMAGILSQADLVLANDSGPLHAAVALGRKVVVPFFCTKPALTGPYGWEVGTLWTPRPCRGSLVRKCPTSMECFGELDWRRVLEVAELVLEKGNRGVTG